MDQEFLDEIKKLVIDKNYHQCMAYRISEEKCISCGTCEAECPIKAISEGEDHFYISPERCNECAGFYDSPRCALACPNDAPEPATDHREGTERLEET